MRRRGRRVLGRGVSWWEEGEMRVLGFRVLEREWKMGFVIS